MSEKKNFTENQILDLGKISPVEKWWISHSILVALEKDLKGKDIKDIENFYKNNISLDAQKAILKISMEVEKNQIPENRKKKWNYKIVYKTDNIDLGKLKKTEEKPKEEVKIENPKVESTETINNSKTEITPTSAFNKDLPTPVIEEKVAETPTVVVEEAKNPTPEVENIPAPMAVTIKTEETENKTEIVLLNDEEAEKIILDILNTKNVDLDWINLLWLKGETKSRENLAQSFVNKLKEEQWWKLIFSKEQIQTIFNTFIEEKEDLNETQTTKKVESLSSYLNEKYSLKAAETYSNWIEQETKNSENLKNELNEKINNLNNKKSKLEADYLDISNTYKKLKDSNDYMEKLIPILNGIWLNSNGLTKEDSDKITNFKDKANENLWTFRENFLQATNIYKSIENEKESKKIILTTTETPVKPEEKKAPAENTPAKPVQPNENKPKSPTPEEIKKASEMTPDEKSRREASKYIETLKQKEATEISSTQKTENKTPAENNYAKPVQNSENKPKGETETKKLENSNEQEILNNFMLVIGNEKLDLDFIWIWDSEQKSREDFAKEFVKYVIEKEWNFSYNQIQINYFMKKAFKQEENIDYGYLFPAEKKKIILDIVYNALQKSKEENFWEQVTPPTNPNQNNRQVTELPAME